MSKRGRKPKPTALKLLEGERADRLNLDEPEAPAGEPDCPDPVVFDEIARVEWARMLDVLGPMGLLSRADGPALAAYCLAFSTWQKAEKDVRTHGVTTTTDLGSIKANPAVTIAKDARRQMLTFLSEFGCTPSSRSRLKAPEKPKDDLADFLAG